MKPQLVYVLWGSDRFTRDEQVRGLRRRMLSEPFGEYNLSELAGDDVSLREVRMVADALPFMGDRRLIIVHGLLGRLTGQAKASSRRARPTRSKAPSKAAAAKAAAAAKEPEVSPTAELTAFLEDLPPTTALVFVEDQIDPAIVEELLPRERFHVRGYQRPRPSDVGRWIEKRVKQHGGRFEAAAIRQLAQLPSEDLGLLDNEIIKLITYAGDRAVAVEDVELLSASPEGTIFDLLDALGQDQRGKALTMLRQLFQRGDRSEALVPQIASSLRRLIQARELLDQGVRGSILATKMGVHPFVAEKTERQARLYRIEQLESALRLLLRTDRAIKTGEAEPELALELYVTDLPRVS
jgi:DNA polymerase-3 subunit delta